MKTKFFLFTCLLFLVFSNCKHSPDTVAADCRDKMLTQNNMIPYDGGNMNGCKFFLMLYEWQGNQYFSLGNPCADMIPKAVDCNGKEMTNPNFWDNATYIGIIGIEP